MIFFKPVFQKSASLIMLFAAVHLLCVPHLYAYQAGHGQPDGTAESADGCPGHLMLRLQSAFAAEDAVFSQTLAKIEALQEEDTFSAWCALALAGFFTELVFISLIAAGVVDFGNYGTLAAAFMLYFAGLSMQDIAVECFGIERPTTTTTSTSGGGTTSTVKTSSSSTTTQPAVRSCLCSGVCLCEEGRQLVLPTDAGSYIESQGVECDEYAICYERCNDYELVLEQVIGTCNSIE